MTALAASLAEAAEALAVLRTSCNPLDVLASLRAERWTSLVDAGRIESAAGFLWITAALVFVPCDEAGAADCMSAACSELAFPGTALIISCSLRVLLLKPELPVLAERARSICRCLPLALGWITWAVYCLTVFSKQ